MTNMHWVIGYNDSTAIDFDGITWMCSFYFNSMMMMIRKKREENDNDDDVDREKNVWFQNKQRKKKIKKK